MIRELDSVVLKTDISEHGLKVGDIGTVVLLHGNGIGYEVEFMTLNGEAITVTSLYAHQIRPIGAKEIAHARAVQF